MTYSIDFRQKVLLIKEQEKLTVMETAVRFGIGVASITRWDKRLEPQRTRTKPATKLDMEALKKDVDNYPDAYQYERAARLEPQDDQEAAIPRPAAVHVRMRVSFVRCAGDRQRRGLGLDVCFSV